MAHYKNLGGNSGIVAYEIDSDSITVQFGSGQVRNYLYTYASAGRENVEKMKSLARAGQGLHSFIMRNVKTGYERKW